MVPRNNLFSIIGSGGPLMLPILFCSVLLFLFACERAISLRRGRVIPRPFVKRFLQNLRDGELDREQALELCEENDSPVARVFGAAVQKWGRSSVEVEQAIIDSGERVTNGLRKYLRLLNGISTISPLLGLLGTVVGMIRAFNDVATADALGRPELLAGGISQALLTTAAGLSVAIPALIVYLFFLSRVDKLVMEIDTLGQHVVNEIAADGTPEKAKKKDQPPSCCLIAVPIRYRKIDSFAGRKMPLKTHHDEQPTLNLTPMIDIVFLLIIFFMVGTKFTEMERKIKLEVPTVSDSGTLSAEPERRIVNVYQDRSITLDQQPVSLEELTSQLASARSQYKDLGVLVRGDADGNFQTVANVLAACKQAGITKLGISVKLANQQNRAGGVHR